MSKVILPLAREVKVADTVLVSVPPEKVTVLVGRAAPYVCEIAEVVDVKLIAGLTVKVTTVEVSTWVVEVSVKVTIARYLYLFIPAVKVLVVSVSVVKPLPLPLVTSAQATDATAVTVSVATCHFIALVCGETREVVPTVKLSVKPAVVVSFVGCKFIVGKVEKENMDP